LIPLLFIYSRALLSLLKVETIGDAYLVASGLPTRNENRHAAEIATFSLQILEFVEGYKIPEHTHTKLQIRVGIHTGLSAESLTPRCSVTTYRQQYKHADLNVIGPIVEV